MRMTSSRGLLASLRSCLLGGAALALLSGAAYADEMSAKDKPAAKPASWWDTFKVSGHVEVGIMANPDGPELNFGHLFTDEANDVLLNQFLVTAERPIDPKAKTFDFGFKFQAYYGSDARYTHFLGELDELIHARNQLDITEAYLVFHKPLGGERSIDIKIGQYVTLEGAEVINAKDNLLYSHSYIFNFGIPFKHTGVLTTTHLNKYVDIYAGIDTGVNTSLGGEGDNNDALAFHGGIGLNLLDGKLTILATTHIGPENPEKNHPPTIDPNSDLRYLNDVTITWKVTDKLTLITDLNYIRDDGLDAEGYGIAQYMAYQINNRLKFVARGEIWRDADGAFVAAFPHDLDFVKFQKGEPATVLSYGDTTYGAITVGLNITPEVPKRFEGLVIRPEVRFDKSFDTKPFNDGTEDTQWTVGVDVIVPFSIYPRMEKISK